MKKALSSLILIFSFLIITTHAQTNFIGMSKSEIIKTMNSEMPDFQKSKVINKTYNYLKYQDALGERTILYFLSDDDICTHSKLMSHYVYLGETVDSLKKNYKKTGKNQWTFTDEGQDYLIELDKGKWFFTVITKKHEEEVQEE
jgi:hypothetical protein